MGATPKKFLLTIMFILLQYNCNGSVVAEAARNVELERQLKIFNKTPVKTIQMGVRDVFDCIDINKQPSLDHPLLKNHVIKTKPIPHSINTTVDNGQEHVSSLSTSSSSYVKSSKKIAILRKLNCPYGTVPIRRTSKEDLIRAKLLFSRSQLVHSSNVRERDDLENPSEGQFYSIAKTTKNSGIDYMGITATISANNPSVTIDQATTAQLWIENGPKEDFNSLQAGWIVAPSLFGDGKTRLFGKWQVDGSNKSEGCYNTFCLGFVQVDKARPIGLLINPISRFAGQTYVYRTSISQDGGGNWWLDFQDIKIGYWPAELGFSQLSRGSSVIAWGGLATQLGGVKTIVPPTGNGYFPTAYYEYDRQCYMEHLKVMPTKSRNWEDPTRKIINTFATNTECSDIKYWGHKPDYGHILAFGGAGGNCL